MLFRFTERLDQPQLALNPDHRWLYDSVDIRALALCDPVFPFIRWRGWLHQLRLATSRLAGGCVRITVHIQSCHDYLALSRMLFEISESTFEFLYTFPFQFYRFQNVIIFLSLILLAGCCPHWGTTSRARSEPHPGRGPHWGTTSRQLQTIDLQTHCLDISFIKMFESSESVFEQTESSLSCTPDAGMYLVKPLLSSNQMAIIPKRRQDPVQLWVDWICQNVSTSTSSNRGDWRNIVASWTFLGQQQYTLVNLNFVLIRKVRFAGWHFNVPQNEYSVFLFLFLCFISWMGGDTIPATAKPPVLSQSYRLFRALNDEGEK